LFIYLFTKREFIHYLVLIYGINSMVNLTVKEVEIVKIIIFYV